MAKDLADARRARRAYLVLHGYDMGGSWWWIRASSAEEMTAAFADRGAKGTRAPADTRDGERV